MKQINKTPEPNSLVQHRANQPASYNGLPLAAKNELRTYLLSEQGYICCYCMKRIPEVSPPYVKVEHFKCQDEHQPLELTYKNLFAACTGNQGKPQKLQTCDTKKANFDLTINLISTAPNCNNLFKYNADGKIKSISDDAEIERQLNDVLNLNMQSLKDMRREVYEEVQRKVEAESRQIGNKQLKLKYFEQEKNKWLNKNEQKFKPFCMVAVYYLSKKIMQFK